MDLSNFPEAIRDKARACRTPEDFLELAKKYGIELTDEQLDGVAGGTFNPCLLYEEMPTEV